MFMPYYSDKYSGALVSPFFFFYCGKWYEKRNKGLDLVYICLKFFSYKKAVRSDELHVEN